MNLALFDFNKTITKKNSSLDFFNYISNLHKFLKVKKILFLPVAIAYAIGFISKTQVSECFITFCFNGWEKSYIDEIAKRYADTLLTKIIRPIALNQIKKHKLNGDRVVVVSASFDFLIEEWCLKNGLEFLCSSIQTKNGLITGKFEGKCCDGIEKVKRIQKKYNIENYDTIFAYGDSRGDKDMLKIADIGFYRWTRIED
jgi:HAD superfamily hydrolase (TIGR01490 family)